MKIISKNERPIGKGYTGYDCFYSEDIVKETIGQNYPIRLKKLMKKAGGFSLQTEKFTFRHSKEQ